MKLGRKGFTVVETLLVLILLAILGFTGYYVYHTQKQTDKTLNTAVNTSANASNSASQTTKHTAKESVAFVQSTYDKYIQASANSTTGAPGALDSIKPDLTSAFYNEAKAKYALPAEVNGKQNPNRPDYDLITCAQNNLSKPVASLKSSDASSSTIEVTDSSYQPPAQFTVTVNLNSLLISAINCPQQ